MMTPNAAAGIRDSIVEGAAKLGLPMSTSMLSLLRCDGRARCVQGRCPVCASTEAQRLRDIPQSPSLSEQHWQRRAYALRSHVRAADDLRPIAIDEIRAAIDKTLNQYVRSFSRQEDHESKNYGCLAEFGLVEDTASSNRGETVVVVEFIVTGGDVDTDYDVMHESLHYNFGVDLYDPFHRPLQVEPISLVSTNGYGVLPNQGLLFGYTKRRLDAAERPVVVSSKSQLAKMACNYGEHPVSHRMFSRGLSRRDEGIAFDPDAPFNL